MAPGSLRSVLQAALQMHGFELVPVDAGVQAREVAARAFPDLILVGSDLTAMDRWHAMKELHGDLVTREIPVLGFEVTPDADAVVSGLVTRIEQALRHRRSRQRPPNPEPQEIELLPEMTVPPVRPRPDHPSAAPPVMIRRARPVSQPPEAPRPPQRDALDSGRILVVDDDALNRDLLTRRLQRRGYEVVVAEDGHQALERAGDGVDVVVLDWMMPGISGIEVLKQLRERHSRIELPVIMASAKAEGEDIVEALRGEANDYVTKPLDFDVVHARIRTQLAVVHLHRQLRDSELQYRALLDNTGDMIVQYRLDGTVLYVSPACRTLLGYEPAELAQQPLTHWMNAADRRALEAQQRRWTSTPPAFTYIARWRRKDQGWSWIETSCCLRAQGAELVVHAACRDVSEHMARLPGDQPPLPLGGDIMAHPGWRGSAPGGRQEVELVVATVLDLLETSQRRNVDRSTFAAELSARVSIALGVRDG